MLRVGGAPPISEKEHFVSLIETIHQMGTDLCDHGYNICIPEQKILHRDRLLNRALDTLCEISCTCHFILEQITDRSGAELFKNGVSSG